MHGYEPPQQQREGSWAEIFAIVVVVFQTLAGPLAVIFGVVALAAGTLIALFTNPPLALIPLSGLVAGVAYLVRRDRRAQAALEREVAGKR